MNTVIQDTRDTQQVIEALLDGGLSIAEILRLCQDIQNNLTGMEKAVQIV